MDGRQYICIDLKSYYSSAECVFRGLDPLTTNLVVADPTRTEKTICLAVSPSLKAHGIPGRARLFEVVERVAEVNAARRRNAPGKEFSGESVSAPELDSDPSLRLGYIVAPPQMSLYMKTSAKIYGIYLKYVAPEDIHVYSVDEVFIDVTHYLSTYRTTARELAIRMIRDVLSQTGITATVGIGTNLYLGKVAMDIVAKKMPADVDGVRIAELDEMSYRRELWSHRPLTDFWRVGRGYAKKLEQSGLYTMGDIARCSLNFEDQLYRMFGVNAELLIDHAWGYEPCTLEDIRAYRPATNSLSSGQVLKEPYCHEKTAVIVREMTELLVLDLVDKGSITDQLTLTLSYDIENLTDPERRKAYHGAVTTDHYGRQVPKQAHGTERLPRKTSSTRLITDAMMRLFDRIADRNLLVRRVTVVACNVTYERDYTPSEQTEQLDLFTDYDALEQEREREEAALAREKEMQMAMLRIKRKYGKNAIIKGTDLQEGATTVERNGQVGGHRA